MLQEGSPGKSPKRQCSWCSAAARALPSSSRSLPKCLDDNTKLAASTIFVSILRIPSFLESRRPRIVAMIAARRLLHHSVAPELWDLEKSELGPWCLQSLRSTMRELRLAAGRALGVLLGGGAPSEISQDTLRQNRSRALSILKSISDKDEPHLHETCVMAWGQAGRVVPDEELNLVLVKLVEYLGHRNMVVSAAAFNELLNLAKSRRTSPKQLFGPFWNNLAFSAVKNLISRPQTTRMVAELLQLSIPELLCLLQHHAVPWLVLTKKREVIQKIADARGDKEIWQTCCDASNLSATLALLLVQEVPDIEDFAMSLFRNISSHFDHLSLVELLGSEPLLTALELFKASAAADKAGKTQVRMRRISHISSRGSN